MEGMSNDSPLWDIFEDLCEWSDRDNVEERLTWINCYVIPQIVGVGAY